MAVRLANYYRLHIRRVAIVASGMLIAINAMLLILFTLLGISWFALFIYILIPAILMQVFALIIILRYALEPLEMITQTLTYVSPQPTVVTPPNYNQIRHERSGLKTMIQTIYDRQPGHETDDSKDSSVLDRVPCGIVMLDSDGQITRYNKNAPILVDSNQNPSLQLLFSETNSLENWLKTATDSKVSDEKFWPRVQDKIPGETNRKIYDVLASYHKSGENGVETMLITLDQTSRYGEDEESVDFLSVAAHELRGPITVIRGYMDVLRSELEDTLQPDQRELIERLDVSASRLSGYVNNILNVAKYDRKHLKLHLREDKLSDVYASIADDLQLRARTQARILNVTIPIDLPTVAADRTSLSEVIANLVDNAIKYSNEGGQVNVTAGIEGNYVRCWIQDHGIGIPSSVASNLFQKFYRSHRSRTTVAGTGLGLFISKAIVESHGGTIGASSTEHEGSTFSFTVPIYATVADKLAAGNNGNEGIIQTSSGWIRNHSKIGG